MKNVVLLLLTVLSFSVYGQRYTGKVLNNCTNRPVEGVKVIIWGTIGGLVVSDIDITDGNGNYSFTMRGTDTYWTIDIIGDSPNFPAGAHSPSAYTLDPANGDRNYLYFTLLPQPKIQLGNAANSIPLIPAQINGVPHIPQPPSRYCVGSDQCVFIPYDYASQYFTTRGATCFRAAVFSYNENLQDRQYLGNTDCISVNGRPEVGNNCEPYSFNIEQFAQASIGRYLELRIIQTCCTSGCPEPREGGGLINQWNVWVSVDGLSSASVDFDFNVSGSVDQNNPGDNAFDGVEPSSSTPPGPALGRFSSAINDTITSSEILTDMTYNLYEVECLTGDDEELVFTETVALNAGQPENYSFVNILDENGDPYFLDPDNFVDKCFKIECIATNGCGTVSEYSYFTVDPNEFLIDNTPGNTALKEELKQHQLSAGGETALYPNPARDQLYINWNEEKSTVEIQVIDLMGKVHFMQPMRTGVSAINVSDLKPGVYFIRFLGTAEKPMRFVKQ